MKHKEQSEYVDKTQRQYETALTRALKSQSSWFKYHSSYVINPQQNKRPKTFTGFLQNLKYIVSEMTLLD